MKLWITTTEAEDGSMTKKRAWGSKDEARAGVGDAANGEAVFVDVDGDKAGIMALFNGDYKINSTEKKFEIKNGKWHTRVG
jgi:hypothetical protein